MPNLPAPLIPCPEQPISQADLLAMLERILPESYLEPMRTASSGYELLQSFAKMLERCSLAVQRLACGSYILTATGGASATVTVSFTRPSAAGGAVTVKAGTVVTASRSGRDFMTLHDAVFGALDLGPVAVPARAVVHAYEWNVPGQVTAADGALLPGDIDTVKNWILEPSYGDATILVTNLAAASGGIADMLDQLGADRGIDRAPSESDATYRARVRKLPATVTPTAIKQTLDAIFAPYGLTTTFIETWQVGYQSCWDAPHQSYVGKPYDPTTFVYDDPRSALPFRNRWLDENDYRGGIIVVVPRVGSIDEHGWVLDEPGLLPSARVSPQTGGRRGASAFDVPNTANAANCGQAAIDGFDARRRAVYKGLYDYLQAARPAGSTAALEVEGA